MHYGICEMGLADIGHPIPDWVADLLWLGLKIGHQDNITINVRQGDISTNTSFRITEGVSLQP